MIKTGINHLSDPPSRWVTPFRRQLKNVSITLYEQALSRPDADELAERILFVFSDERGAFKRTYVDRFEDFDAAVLEVLERTFEKRSALFVHDVGVSDARTSVDFFRKLSAVFGDLRFTASDHSPKVYVLERKELKVTLSSTGRVLEIARWPFVFSMMRPDSYWLYPGNYIVRCFMQRFFVAPLLKTYGSGQIAARELLIFSPAALELANTDERFRLEQHDLLRPFKDRADVIRAVNVLNRTYFTTTELSRVVKNMYEALSDGGLLVTGSNEDPGSLVHGGVYRKAARGFENVWRSGDGSQIEREILGFQRKS